MRPEGCAPSCSLASYSSAPAPAEEKEIQNNNIDWKRLNYLGKKEEEEEEAVKQGKEEEETSGFVLLLLLCSYGPGDYRLRVRKCWPLCPSIGIYIYIILPGFVCVLAAVSADTVDDGPATIAYAKRKRIG